MELSRYARNYIGFGCILMAMTFTPGLSLAGTGGGGTTDGGGGDLIICRGNQMYVADYFQEDRALPDNVLKRHIGRDEAYLEAIILRHLEYAAPSEAKLLKSVNLTFRILDGETLPELEDDGIQLSQEDVRNGCHKVQLAIQNLKTGEVNVAGFYYNQLTIFQKAILRIHERYINLLKQPGKTTDQIRKRTMALLSSGEFNDMLIYSFSFGDPAMKQGFRVEFALGNSVPLNVDFNFIEKQYSRFGFPAFNIEKAKNNFSYKSCLSQVAAEKLMNKDPYLQNWLWFQCIARAIGVSEKDVTCWKTGKLNVFPWDPCATKERADKNIREELQ